MRWLLFVLAVTLSAGGCRGTVVDRVGIDIRLPSAPQCRDAIGAITLTSLGDFPTNDGDVVQLDAMGTPFDPVTRFRTSTLAFSVSARASTWDAFGWAMRGSIGPDPFLVLLPLGRSCPLADSEARLPVGAAVAVIDDARVMFVGGLDDTGRATRRVAILHVRDERVELPRMDDAFTTAFAAATLVPEGDAVIVTGGVIRDDAQQNWMRIPLDGGPLVVRTLREARRDHGSIAVSAGPVHGVLLVGGSDGQRALRSIEWIDPVSQTSTLLGSMLAVGRIGPRLVMLDGSHVAIVGGDDDTGHTVTDVEVLDLVADTIGSSGTAITRLLATNRDAGLGPVDPGDWLAVLPSGRLAWSMQVTTPTTHRVLRLTALGERQAIALPDVFDPIASTLPSGRILLEGSHLDHTRVAYIVDPGADTVTPIDVSRVPTGLVALADGSTLELAPTAASIRRDERATPFDAPPPSYLFGLDRGSFALDAASRWTVSASGLSPSAGIDDARLDLPVLRLSHFEALLDADGAYDVVLTGTHLETLATVSVTDGAISVGTCSTPRGTRVRIVRAADALRIGTESALVTCPVPSVDAEARVGLGIVAHEGATLRSLALTRSAL